MEEQRMETIKAYSESRAATTVMMSLIAETWW
jgi:hypothetical protein